MSRQPANHQTTWRALRSILPFVAMLSLTGCSGLLERTEKLSQWEIEPVPAARAGAALDWQLIVEQPQAADPLNGTRLVLDPGNGEVGVYRGARWSQPAPRLLQEVLLRSLTDSGRIIGLGRGTDGLRAHYRLLWDLRAFRVERAATEQAQVAVSARLLRTSDGSVVAAQRFAASASVNGAGVAAVVAAFQAACAEVLPALAEWTLAAGQADFSRGKDAG